MVRLGEMCLHRRSISSPSVLLEEFRALTANVVDELAQRFFGGAFAANRLTVPVDRVSPSVWPTSA